MTTIKYEKKECTRCGGSGSYSFNLRHGTMCYGCSGSGEQLTTNGKRAMKRMKEFKAENYSRLASDVEVGSFINENDGCYRKVLSVTDQGVCKLNGNHYFKIETQKVNYILQKTIVVEVRPTKEQFLNEMVPFAKRFSGAIIS